MEEFHRQPAASAMGPLPPTHSHVYNRATWTTSRRSSLSPSSFPRHSHSSPNKLATVSSPKAASRVVVSASRRNPTTTARDILRRRPSLPLRSALPKGADPRIAENPSTAPPPTRVPFFSPQRLGFLRRRLSRRLKMADVPFVQPAAAETSRNWSLFTWTPTSVTLAQAAENRLLSRFQYFKPTVPGAGAASPAEATAASAESHSVKNAGDTGSFPDVASAEHHSPASSSPNHHERVIARVGLVALDQPGQMINTFVIDRTDESLKETSRPGILRREMSHGSGNEEMVHLEQDVAPVEEVGRTGPKKKVLVMAHGYGAGLGFFYRNFAGLSQVPGWRIYAIDWLGMANSSRPPFPKLPRNATDEQIVADAETFFIDSLEQWRKANSIDQMTLMGHSLGGYLSTAYALKYPQYVEKLILVSPAGVGQRPEVDIRSRRGLLPKLFTAMWTWNLTPMTVIRSAGPWGPGLVKGYTDRRFSYLDETDAKDFRDYIFHISAQPGSGEFALSRLLLPGAYARIPLHDRLAKLKMPTVFLYGSHDWMDYRFAVAAAEHMKVPTRIARIAGAGHHLYLDNAVGFNNAMIAEMRGRKKGVRVPDVEYVLEQ
ncbi:Alpha/Beta hydrolase protein [Fimicolochytrium jonesii]|uniref:Alpha/Beta hydrolase protein n=1 Tax=Fimicolochytrium jonesii TaxID=1396493 RepID=UPI0022FDC1DE|nr:Alpha/Beta hydrolase protein [Fimicolochytrium jonesii]KAI8819567.1 Alpha/Beta hydrolase protein [Fimicolochytrium jonesii]